MGGTSNRRVFLRRSLAVGAGALGVSACTRSATGIDDQGATPAPFDPRDWASVRAQFDLARDPLQFSAFVLAAHPAPVRTMIEAHRRGLDTDGVAYLHAHEKQGEEQVRAAAAEYLGTSQEEIAFTGSTTAGLGLLYGGLRLRPGDEVLTTEHDFYSTHEALRLNAEGAGAAVRKVRLYGDPLVASADQIVARARAAVRPRTRVVAVTWVHSSTGVMLPVRAIADALAQINAGRDEPDRALLCVDAFTASASTLPAPSISAATSSSPARTSGCSARAAPG